MPGLLDQYRQQRRAWLAQADELVRMRDEVRLAAEREALEIVTAARRDVRRIIVEARRELLVLTAQLHAAVEATDAPGLDAPPLAPLLADPDAKSRVDAAAGGALDVTRDVVLGARKEVRSVLDEARAEIEALSSEAPAAFGTGTPARGGSPEWPGVDAQAAPAPSGPSERFDASQLSDDETPAEGPVHELSLDDDLADLDFQARDLPIPTLARILGTDVAAKIPGLHTFEQVAPTHHHVFEAPPIYETPRLSELRSLLRDPIIEEPHRTHLDLVPAVLQTTIVPAAIVPAEATPLAPEPTAAAELQVPDDGHATTPGDEPGTSPATFDVQRFTPPSRLFMEDPDARTAAARSARTFVGLFAAIGALGLLVTGWWITRDSAGSLSAATPPAVVEKTAARPLTTPAAATPVAARSGLSLDIEARKPSWIRVQVDGKDEIGRTFQAGETRHISGARTVSVRAGDAGAVFVAVDGGTARAIGANGTPATKEFSAPSPNPAAGVTPSVADASAPKGGASAVLTSAPVTGALPPAGQTVAKRTDAHGPLTASASVPIASSASAGEAASAPSDSAPGGRPDLVQAGQQWLDAYQRRDRDAMATSGTENITVSDERSVTERFPAWQGNVRRDLDQVELELTGDTALLTARMTEHTDGAQSQHISRVSQIWVRRAGRWRLADVRIIGEARLNQIVR